MTVKYKGLIFDMDGLLFDTERLYCEANIKIAPKYGLKNYDEDYYMRYVGISDEELFEHYYQDFAYLERSVVDQFIEDSHQEVKKMFIAGLAPLKPGVIELLDYCHEQEIPAIVASSNLRQFIDILLDKAEIRDRFTGVVSCEDVAKAKPDPEIVIKATEKLRLLPSECLMLEDSYNGVRAAYAAEVPVVMVPDLLPPTTEISKMATAVLPDLVAVKKYLEK